MSLEFRWHQIYETVILLLKAVCRGRGENKIPRNGNLLIEVILSLFRKDSCRLGKRDIPNGALPSVSRMSS